MMVLLVGCFLLEKFNYSSYLGLEESALKIMIWPSSRDWKEKAYMASCIFQVVAFVGVISSLTLVTNIPICFISF